MLFGRATEPKSINCSRQERLQAAKNGKRVGVMGLTPPFLWRLANSMVSEEQEGWLRGMTHRDEPEQDLRMGSCTEAVVFGCRQLLRDSSSNFWSYILGRSSFISFPSLKCIVKLGHQKVKFPVFQARP